MPRISKAEWNELLANAQRRLPAGRCFLQEAFTSDRRRPVLVKLGDLQADTFYWFDTMTASALFDAVIEHAARRGGRLTVGCPDALELRASIHRLQHIAAKLQQVRLLAPGQPARQLLQGARLEHRNITGTPLAPYRIALGEGAAPLLFVAREQRERSLGFLTTDADLIEDAADDMDALLHGMGRRLDVFERLERLHQTTQQITRELDSYARRLQLAIARARRRPDLLTPARFERIVAQSIAKMEQLKEIPRRALRTMGQPRR